MTIEISIGDMLIQYGCSPKDSANERINFRFESASAPTVLVTPEWTKTWATKKQFTTLEAVISKFTAATLPLYFKKLFHTSLDATQR